MRGLVSSAGTHALSPAAMRGGRQSLRRSRASSLYTREPLNSIILDIFPYIWYSVIRGFQHFKARFGRCAEGCFGSIYALGGGNLFLFGVDSSNAETPPSRKEPLFPSACRSYAASFFGNTLRPLGNPFFTPPLLTFCSSFYILISAEAAADASVGLIGIHLDRLDRSGMRNQPLFCALSQTAVFRPIRDVFLPLRP